MQKLLYIYESIPRALRNKYVLTAFFFIIWLLFFDNNKILSQVKMRKNLKDMELRKDFYKEEINIVNKELEMFDDPDALQTFARENYLLKKEDEVIILIETTEEGIKLVNPQETEKKSNEIAEKRN